MTTQVNILTLVKGRRNRLVVDYAACTLTLHSGGERIETHFAALSKPVDELIEGYRAEGFKSARGGVRRHPARCKECEAVRLTKKTRSKRNQSICVGCESKRANKFSKRWREKNPDYEGFSAEAQKRRALARVRREAA